ncbi:transcriptional regulator [Rhodococcoides fascians]|uniref:transcriptional regulator n=1 Tax=Rhodococcoides fascians TaxID=1828 RepID=UPI0015C64752|nr:transcriptional regulator [Rhodococcus fascians]
MARHKTNPAAAQQTPLEMALTAILTDTPRLDGAACIGHGALFDPPGDGELRDAVDTRHRAAARLCWTCPALDACRDWATGESSSGSVIAAQVMSATGRTDNTEASEPRGAA